VLHIKYYSSEQIKKNKMGTWHVWETGEVQTGFGLGYLRQIDHLEDLVVDGKIILKLIFKKWDGFMYWITGVWK
jgi:hypothetical protein